MATVTLVGEGLLTVNEEGTSHPRTVDMAVEIQNLTIQQAPSILLVSVTEALPDVQVDFYIDGLLSYSAVANSVGELPLVSIAITRERGTAGSHTLVVQQAGATTATATFSITLPPPVEPTAVGIDADPIEIPGAVTSNGTRRWVFQDLFPTVDGGIGSWIMPMNPQEMTSPILQVQLSSMHTTADGGRTRQVPGIFPTDDGRHHIFEGSIVPQDWTFKGYCPTEEMHDMMMKYRNLNRRIYIIDHRNRAFKVAIVDIAFTPRLRQIFNGVPTDWGADYEATCVVLDQTYATPV